MRAEKDVENCCKKHNNIKVLKFRLKLLEIQYFIPAWIRWLQVLASFCQICSIK